MEFEDIWCCVKSKKKTAFAHDSIGHWHWTLRGVRGKVCAPRSLCVLGPSGSGKTTLLAALGMQLQHSSTRWITGKLKVPEHSIAYVPQDTPFFSNLTVRETLNFAAKMESRRGEDIEPKVDYVTRKLGLGHCVNTLVGGDLGGHFVRGISGGERRRLAIACEMLRTYCAEPEEMTVLIADEPTTGLDAFQADKVIENLLSIAHEKEALVVMCIHQPRSAIYNKLDDIMLLGPGGYTCYTGDAQEAVKYFETMGYKCPDMHNPAEFLIDLVSIDTSSVQSEKESWQRIISLSEAWKSKGPSLRNLNASTRSEANKSQSDESAFMQSDSKKKRLGVLSQIGLLVKRNFIQASREKYIHTTRAIGTIILGLAFGSCHPKLGFGQKSIQRRAAVMLQVCINSSMMATIKTLNSFPKERAVVRKELAKKRKDGSSAYSVGSYFLSKLLIESPIDAFFPVLFGSVVAPLSGLNRKMRWPFLGTLALQGISASSVGMSIGAFAPNTETALAIGNHFVIWHLQTLTDSSYRTSSNGAIHHVGRQQWGLC